MTIIEQNPYRILGVLTNSSTKEITANYGKIKAFSKTSKPISFDYDFSKLLKPIERTEELSTRAFNAVTLPKDKFSFGLFWFMQSTDNDKIALNHLRLGNLDSAISVLRKDITVSACINIAVINLIQKKWTSALYYYVYLLNDSGKRNEFLHTLIDNHNLLSEDEVIQLFVDKLIISFPEVSWMESLIQTEVSIGGELFEINDFFKKSNLYAYFTRRICEQNIKDIESCLRDATLVEKINAKKNLRIAKKLEEIAKTKLRSLRLCLGKESNTYISLCDKVATQILDNCTDYYNHDKENPLRSRNIIKLLKFTVRIAQGEIAKNRCKNNYDCIQQECDSLLPEEIEPEVSYINKQIEEFNRLNSVSSYEGYLDATLCGCFKRLEQIKTIVGAESKHYINISASVVNFGIDIIIGFVNAKIKQYDECLGINNAKELLELRKALKWGCPIFDTLKLFAKDQMSASLF